MIIRTDPRTRKVETTYLAGIICVIAVIGALALSGVIHNDNPPSTIAAMMAAMIAGLAALLVRLHRDHVVLRADGIDVVRAFWPTRHLARADIVARRVHPGGWRSALYHILITRDGGEVSLPPYLEHNPELQAWLKAIPLSR